MTRVGRRTGAYDLVEEIGHGGTTDDGVPYLVMELVRGMPLDQDCDQRRLDVTASPGLRYDAMR